MVGPYFELSFDADPEDFKRDCDLLLEALPKVEFEFRKANPDLWEAMYAWYREHMGKRGKER